eukprot:3489561-Prymnesium_polylepis.1
MMTRRYPMDSRHQDLLELSNIFFTSIFALEMILKLLALGFASYWRDAFNRFDGFIVIISIAEIVLERFDLPLDTQPLRAFRILRIFKLLRSWKTLQRLLSAFLNSLYAMADLVLLLLLLIFIFGLLGMQLFGNKFVAPTFEQRPRTNFDSMEMAMLACTIVVTGESWDDIYMHVQRAVGSWSALFFVVLIVVGNYMLVNLLVALLIVNFDAKAMKALTFQPSSRAPRRMSFTGREKLEASGGAEASSERDAKLLRLEQWLVDRLPTAWRDTLINRASYSLLLFAPDHPVRIAC